MRLAINTGLFLWLVCGQLFSAETRTLRSHSGQFLVRGLSLGASRRAEVPNPEVAYVRLDPTLLAVSCERIKSAVLEELGMKDSWKGKIYISLHPVRADGEPIVVTSTHYGDGWNYHLEIPEQVDAGRLVRSVVEVLLLETAQRNSRSVQAELPLWLTEGLSAHLQSTTLCGFTLEPETRVARKQRGFDPLARARDCLRNHSPLTLDELTWPQDEQFSRENLEIYQSCAQLFVSELLRLRDGRACLREMLERLPERLNWQTAFLGAFSGHFQRLLDVDKWWSLHVVHFTGQGMASIWTREESLKQLDEILMTPMQVRLSATELPLTIHAKLQTILGQWDFQRQRSLLLIKLNLLAALRLRSGQDVIRLVEAYHQNLESYLQRRAKAGGASKAEPSAAAKVILKETTKTLDALDAQRQAFRGQTNTPATQLSISR